MRAALLLAAVVGLLAAPGATARPADKLDARLAQLANGKRARVMPGGASVRPAGAPVRNGKVLVDVYVRGAMRDGAAALRGEGMRVETTSARAPFRIVEGWVPVTRLDDIAAQRSTRAAVAVQEPIYNTGSATSEGDAVHRGPEVRAQGFTGAGIAVGVMSDSINKRGTGVAGSQATNDLPPTVQILAEPGSGTDEGRAMAQIVYDEAPGISKIIFATGSGGAVNRAANIDALVAAGSKVIADDVVYLGEPFFQDGVVAQAADRAKAAGVGYFVSAGNRARQSWEGTFTPAASTPAENDFDTGPGEDRRQTVATLSSASQQLSVFLQWANPIGAVTDDFALDVYDASGSTLLQTFDSNNVATGIPAEAFSATGPLTFTIAIRRVAGTGNPPLKWIANGSFSGSVPAEFPNAPAIDPDAASARGALAVAAVRHNDAGLDTAEAFSSRGPTVTRFFGPTGNTLATPDVRAKPDIAAADGVATTTDFDTGSPDLNPFFGTSAAAPSAAGVAALLWSAKPSLSVDELYAILRDPRGSIDCTSAAGFPDGDCGSGFLLADGKLAMVLDSTPPVVSAATSPGLPDGANGWFHGDVGVTWNVADAESPVSSQTDCGPQTVATDGVVTFTCSAASAGGATTQSATVKRDGAPPSPPSFTGITDGASFTTGTVPAANAIGCAATDATSGVVSCVVSGLSKAVGDHTLTATATDESGLTSTSALSYEVTKAPKAARSLKVDRQTIGSVLRSGFKFTLTVGTDSTRVNATLKLAGGTSKAGGKTLGRLHKTVKRGKRKLTVKLSPAGERRLRGLRRAKLTLTVKASSPTAARATLKKSTTLRG